MSDQACKHFDVADGVCLECGHGVLRFSIITNDTPDGYVLLSPSDIEKVRGQLERWRAFCIDAGLSANAASCGDALALLDGRKDGAR